MLIKKARDNVIQVYTTSKWVIEIYFEIAPRLTLIYFSTQAILRTESIINAYLFGYIIDKIIFLTQTSSVQVVDFAPVLALFILVRFVFSILSTISNNSGRLLSLKDSWVLRTVLYRRLAQLGISTLENPQVSNKAQRFMEAIGGMNNHLMIIVRIFAGIVSLIAATGVILGSAPGILPVFAISALLSSLIDQNFIRTLWKFNVESTEYRRKASADAYSLSDSNALKELLATGGYSYLHKRVVKFINYYVGKVGHVRKRWVLAKVVENIIGLTAFAGGFIYILQKLIAKSISLGAFTFQIRSLSIFSDSFSNLALEFVTLRESTIKVSDSIDLFDTFEPDPDGRVTLPINSKPPVIEFRDVHFAYPTGTKGVLKNISLTINAGEKIAIVGENGVGKTTLVRLLLRIYRVSNGQILINGEDINSLSISSWYSKVGVLFQDFNQYGHLTVKENVGIGDIGKGFDDEKIILALKKADAYSFVEKYPRGIDQILSEKYEGGIRPSTGQWQKIALARFFYRDAPVLILDEPTASIDAIAEAQIFDNIYKFIKNKTVIIISHRFSTVRNADRIIVLHNGEIVEEGNHKTLSKKKNGKYAHAFNLQARGYE